MVAGVQIQIAAGLHAGAGGERQVGAGAAGQIVAGIQAGRLADRQIAVGGGKVHVTVAGGQRGTGGQRHALPGRYGNVALAVGMAGDQGHAAGVGGQAQILIQ